MIKPSLFTRIFITTRKKAAIVFVGLIFLSLYLIGITSPQTTIQNTAAQQIKKVSLAKKSITPVPTVCPTDTTKDYKVIGCAILQDDKHVPYRMIEAVIDPANTSESKAKTIATELKQNDCGKSCAIDLSDELKTAQDAFAYNQLKTDAEKKQFKMQHPDFLNNNHYIATIDDTNNGFIYWLTPTGTPDSQSNDTTSTTPQVSPVISAQKNSGLSNNNYYTNVDGNQVHSPASSNNGQAPAGATAKCNDGVYSFSQHHSGTCSGHGGVAQWL